MNSNASDTLLLTSAERLRGQACALRANLLTNVTQTILIGSLMMLFASDVLGYSPQKIASVLACVPLLSLLRFALLGPIRRAGLRKALNATSLVRMTVIAVLLVVPASRMSLPLYMGLLMIYVGAFHLGPGMVWQPLLRGITEARDRGRFFARQRFWFTMVTSTVMLAVPWLVGERISELQYKALLLLALTGSINFFWWSRRIPEVRPSASDTSTSGGSWRRLAGVVRGSKLLRKPLLIQFLLFPAAFPVYVLYLKQILHVPTQMASAYLTSVTIGMALSFLLWGRIADALGFRPMLLGLLVLNIAALPLQLLIRPLPAQISGWGGLDATGALSMGVLLLYGLASGALGAGTGIATTSIEHHHVDPEDALEAMNMYQLINMGMASAQMAFAGFWLGKVASATGEHYFLGGLLHLDGVKGYLLFCGAPAMVAAMAVVATLPNARPHFGLSDFFSCLTTTALRQIKAERRVRDEDEETRVAAAEWFSQHAGPLAIDPLMDMLQDPSYDVRVAVIRALARTGSPLAGARLRELLQNGQSQSVADHAAWALGELRYQPAFTDLLSALAPSQPHRVRAMAARALGKLGDLRAVPQLVITLQTAGEDEHVLASACRGLIRLQGTGHGELLFTTLASLTDREERFELMEALCGHFGLSNEWLLRFARAGAMRQGLEEFVSHQPARWQSARAEVATACKDRNLAALQRLMTSAVAGLPEARTAERALNTVLQRAERWNAVSIMAAAWLLLREPS